MYYFERNGNICVVDIISKYAFYLFTKSKWNKLYNKNIHFKELINNYLINDIKDTDNIKILEKIFNENIDFDNINAYEKMYNEIPQLQK